MTAERTATELLAMDGGFWAGPVSDATDGFSHREFAAVAYADAAIRNDRKKVFMDERKNICQTRPHE